MNREQAKQFLPIIQAFADGETIQMRRNGEWGDMVLEDPFFNSGPECYRIKPKPLEGWVAESGHAPETTTIYPTREFPDRMVTNYPGEYRVVKVREVTE
jgi:hypothetical protein